MDSGQYEFGVYRLDAQSRLLFKKGERVRIPAKLIRVSVESGRAGVG